MKIITKNILLFLITSGFYSIICAELNTNVELYITNITHFYSTTYTLPNEEILVVNEDGIYLYNSELTQENLKVNISATKDELFYLLVEQYPSSKDGYIMIILKEILFIFDSEANFYSQVALNNSNYCTQILTLIPYSKTDNYLHYIIGCNMANYLVFLYYKFDIDSKINELYFTVKYIFNNLLYNIKCKIMETNKEILTCFYSITDNSYLFSSSFEFETNLTKIEEYEISKKLNESCTLILPKLVMTNQNV